MKIGFSSLLPGCLRLLLGLGLVVPLSLPTLGQAEKPAAKPSDKPASLPSAQEIIDRSIKASGGREAFLKLESQRIQGKYELAAQGLTGDLEVLSAKPNKILIKINFAGVGPVTTGYDGKVAWLTTQLTGPKILEGKEAADLIEQADFYAPLHDPSQYKSMETVDKTQFEGADCYKVKLIRKNDSERTEYYDVKSGLMTGLVAKQTVGMAQGEVTVTNVFGDYRSFGALQMPTKIVQRIGVVEPVMQITTIEFNKVDPSVFELPADVKALLK